jgi:CSLREA domain-containing protein
MSLLKTFLTAVFFTLFFCFSFSIAPAATYTATKTADTNDGVCDSDCSLREAVAQASAFSDSDEINFDPQVFSTPQTIVLTNGQINIALSDTTTINGPGAHLLTISGNNQSRIFFSNWGGTFLNISNMTLTEGFATYGGAAALSNMTTLSGMVITGNKAAGSEIFSNQAGGFGGGLYVSGSSFVLVDSVVSNNEASGVLVQSPNGVISGSGGFGGGIYSGNSATIVNFRFTNNVAH